MKLSEYFDKARGTGVLATADAEGRPNVAVYARPHFPDEETVAFIMADRHSYANVRANGHAAYLFREAGDGYAGRRLHLTKVREDDDAEAIQAMRRRQTPEPCTAESEGKRHLVYFRVEKVRPLIGEGQAE